AIGHGIDNSYDVIDAEATALLHHSRGEPDEIHADPGAWYGSTVDQARETKEELFGRAVVVERSGVCECKALALRSDPRRGGTIEVKRIIAVEKDLGLGATCGIAPMEVDLHSVARKDDFVGVEDCL